MQLDPEEQREAAQTHAATHQVTRFKEKEIRAVTMATYVMLTGTGNSFFTGGGRSRMASFDACVFMWMHTASEAQVFGINWQDRRELVQVVTAWINTQSPALQDVVEFAKIAAEAAKRLLSAEFRMLGDQISAEKKSKDGPTGP